MYENIRTKKKRQITSSTSRDGSKLAASEKAPSNIKLAAYNKSFWHDDKILLWIYIEQYTTWIVHNVMLKARKPKCVKVYDIILKHISQIVVSLATMNLSKSETMCYWFYLFQEIPFNF